MFAFFLCDKCFPTMGTAQGERPGKTVLRRGEVGVTYFALELTGLPVVAVKEGLGGIAGRAAAAIRDVTGFTPGDGFDLFPVAELKVRDEELPVPSVLME